MSWPKCKLLGLLKSKIPSILEEWLGAYVFFFFNLSSLFLRTQVISIEMESYDVKLSPIVLDGEFYFLFFYLMGFLRINMVGLPIWASLCEGKRGVRKGLPIWALPKLEIQ